ncbi:hypothetical protein [Acidovorax sp. SUPP3334]|uniref:hypothetical protein n=1 Tax=Acidovorax sp. SUPP3334 TaxID=2920881 RepID=UPI0023DE5BCB|nr:hypothetical protein [Acidovorax sp. SUPP3334]GKT26235.1 hypothetical protein AVHM3334_20435 [Acidovorax sp. SUPP3334]
MPKTAPATKTSVAASTKPASVLPEGFVSPFNRVEMQPGVRIDDGLCCVAMLPGVNYSERPASIILSGAVEHVH